LEDFSIENVRSQLAEAQKIASGNGSEQDIAEAKIEIEVRIFERGRARTSDNVIGFGELAGRPQVSGPCVRGILDKAEDLCISQTLFSHDALCESMVLCATLFGSARNFLNM
jgi:hypothetical protein